jgi:hypothetical protein
VIAQDISKQDAILAPRPDAHDVRAGLTEFFFDS